MPQETKHAQVSTFSRDFNIGSSPSKLRLSEYEQNGFCIVRGLIPEDKVKAMVIRFCSRALWQEPVR